MLNAICLLPPEVINKISAGEVVDRPAHLIKELIENSLDAKACKIEINFSEGGQFVQITDNGYGIKPKQLHLALSPHSTSKIKSVEDIWGVNSYGFRGEALASIAAVSELTLVSKAKGENQSYRIKSDFGKQTPIEKVNSEQGSVVIVKNLFKNVPARLKFLKSESAETTLIKSTIKAMALTQPQVEFKVLYKNKLLFYWPSTKNIQQRVETILSLEQTFYTKLQYQDIYGEAVICAPNNTFSHRRNMWFFVEKRWIQDTVLHAAVMSAYRGLLMHGEYPVVVVNIQCPKTDLDVNVHPTKSKVRFNNTAPVFRAVHHGIRAVLETAPWINNNSHKNETLHLNENTDSKVHNDSRKNNNVYPKKNTEFKFLDKTYDTVLFKKNISSLKMDINTPSETQKNPKNCNLKQKSTYWACLDILSQAYLTYIVAQNRDGLIFIDQHAAHERVLYEQFMLYWNTGRGEIQNRLVPLTLTLEETLVNSIISVQKKLVKIGIHIELSGPNELAILSTPAILKDVALQKSLLKLAEDILSQGDSFAIEKQISDLCASMACHSAIRAGQALSKEEIKQLLTEMDLFALSSFCPHGRPVFVEYPLSQLEKDFCRKI